ncbi:hypothetical protein BASA83_001600 [Batrachochytrium salamandrivorans]|nr:hypothetical protein BASA81_013150 [Batrachochytrium salamandrivorans]KAH9275798.1 hypothetical protein BASA83_001600 [Batrachochytrium salamandrivorans]
MAERSAESEASVVVSPLMGLTSSGDNRITLGGHGHCKGVGANARTGLLSGRYTTARQIMKATAHEHQLQQQQQQHQQHDLARYDAPSSMPSNSNGIDITLTLTHEDPSSVPTVAGGFPTDHEPIALPLAHSPLHIRLPISSTSWTAPNHATNTQHSNSNPTSTARKSDRKAVPMIPQKETLATRQLKNRLPSRSMSASRRTLAQTALAEQESKISKWVIKIGDPKQYSLIPLAQKQRQFLETVTAVRAIMLGKMYKATSSESIQGYFQHKWNVSRAQVYRLLDCWTVLDALKDAHILPYKERICRTLKRCSKIPQELILLWDSVLDACRMDDTSITPKSVADSWASLKHVISTNKENTQKSVSSTQASMRVVPEAITALGPPINASPTAATVVYKDTNAQPQTLCLTPVRGPSLSEDSNDISHLTPHDCDKSHTPKQRIRQPLHLETPHGELFLSSDLFSEIETMHDGNDPISSGSSVIPLTNPRSAQASSSSVLSDELSSLNQEITLAIDDSNSSEISGFLHSMTSESMDIDSDMDNTPIIHRRMRPNAESGSCIFSITADLYPDQSSDPSVDQSFSEGLGSSIQPLNNCGTPYTRAHHGFIRGHGGNKQGSLSHTACENHQDNITSERTTPEIPSSSYGLPISPNQSSLLMLSGMPGYNSGLSYSKSPAATTKTATEELTIADHFVTSPGSSSKRRYASRLSMDIYSYQPSANIAYHRQITRNPFCSMTSTPVEDEHNANAEATSGTTTCTVNHYSNSDGDLSMFRLPQRESKLDSHRRVTNLSAAALTEEIVFGEWSTSMSHDIKPPRSNDELLLSSGTFGSSDLDSDGHYYTSPNNRRTSVNGITGFGIGSGSGSGSVEGSSRHFSGLFNPLQSMLPFLSSPLKASRHQQQRHQHHNQTIPNAEGVLEVSIWDVPAVASATPPMGFITPAMSTASLPTVAPSSISPVPDLTASVTKLQDAWRELTSLGYAVQPYVGGDWYAHKIPRWRIRWPSQSTSPIDYHSSQPLNYTHGVPLFSKATGTDCAVSGYPSTATATATPTPTPTLTPNAPAATYCSGNWHDSELGGYVSTLPVQWYVPDSPTSMQMSMSAAAAAEAATQQQPKPSTLGALFTVDKISTSSKCSEFNQLMGDRNVPLSDDVLPATVCSFPVRSFSTAVDNPTPEIAMTIKSEDREHPIGPLDQ